MHIVVHCQYRENYGSEERPHWKNKGGASLVFPMSILGVERYDTEIMPSQREMDELVKLAIPEGEIYSNPMSEQFMLDWGFEDLSDVYDESDEIVDPWSPNWDYRDHYTFLCDYRMFKKGKSYFLFSPVSR